MFRFLGIFLIISVLFYGVFSADFVKEKFNVFLAGINDKLTANLFPKTQKEILIDNLSDNYNLLDRFFSESVPRILGAEDVSEEDKKTIKNAVEAFVKSKDLIGNISQLEKQDKSITKTVIDKILGSNDSAPPNEPDPTHIPPQCRLEC